MPQPQSRLVRTALFALAAIAGCFVAAVPAVAVQPTCMNDAGEQYSCTFGQPAPPGSEVIQSITVTRRQGMCGGLCPDYTISVRSDGRVSVRQGRHPARNYRIRAAEFGTFASHLEPYRSGEPAASPAACRYHPPHGAIYVGRDQPDIEISWSGPPAAQLLVCADRRVAGLENALATALPAIGLDQMGLPRGRE